MIADEELRRLSGLIAFRYSPAAERKEQEASIRGWERWWASEERYRRLKKVVLPLSEFDYDLPDSLIAQTPCEPA